MRRQSRSLLGMYDDERPGFGSTVLTALGTMLHQNFKQGCVLYHANTLQQLPEKLQSIPALCILTVRCGNGESELINHQLNKPPALSRWKQSFFHTNTNILTLAQTPTQHLVSSVSADPFVFASGALALLETTGTNIIRSK